MKILPQNNIAYVGKVTIIKKVNGNTFEKRVCNNGTVDLFVLLAKTIAGYDETKNIPKFLRIEDSNGNAVSKLCPLTGIVYTKLEQTAKTTFNCVLTKDDLIVTNFSEKSDYKLCLYNLLNVKLATVDIKGDAVSGVNSNGTETDIIWELEFGNR